jgi:KDO2-lipid IV(A) lauroyltransferase
MKFLSALFFYLLVFLFALIPFRLVYLLSDLNAFLLRHVFGYRKKVILGNLAMIFPELTGREQEQLVGRIYRNLSDIIIEGIKAFFMTRCQVNRRHVIRNPEILEPFYQQGRGVIVVTGHYGNWEWGAFSPSLQTPYTVIGFYKPIRNPMIDSFVRRSRARFGARLASIYETARTFEENQGKPVIYLMAADQYPPNLEKAHTVTFLGRPTPFLHGPEKYARLNDCVVVYVDIRRQKRGYYKMELSVLTETPSELPVGEITRRFAAKLESVIREDPANWLWSHKRWKSNG